MFVEIVDLGSFGACADRLGVTQVSVSGHVRALEQMIGRPLFHRRRGAASDLTEDGKQLYRHAVPLLSGWEGLIEDMAPARDGSRRRRLIVAAPGYVTFRISHVFGDFNQNHPMWHVEHETNSLSALDDMVRKGRADLAFVMSTPDRAPAGAIPLWTERLGLYVRADHPLAGRPAVLPAAMARYPLIQLPHRDSLRHVVDKALETAGILGNPVILHTASAMLARRSLAENDAICCLFAPLVERDLARGELAELAVPRKLPPVQVSAVCSNRVLVRRGVDALIAMVIAAMAADQPAEPAR